MMYSRLGRRRWRYAPLVMLAFGFICFLRVSFSSDRISEDAYHGTVIQSRHLMNLHTIKRNNMTFQCLPQAISDFPHDIFTNEQRRHGFVLIHVMVAVYMFVGLAIVCDEYFVPCLECICESLNLQPDVAGATFMAAGSSAPEMATTIIGVFITKDDIGLGAVVGSADYNLMFVISVCALLAKTVIYLNWWPLVRDCTVYSISVVVLAFIIYDGNVHWYESFVLILLYFLYVILMYFNPRLEAYFLNKCAGCLPVPKNSPTNKYLLRENNADRDLELAIPLTTTINGSCLEEIALEEEEGTSSPSNGAYRPIPSDKINASSEALNAPENSGETSHDGSRNDNAESQGWVISWPSDANWFFKGIHVFSFPLKLVLFITVPDCRQLRFRKCFWLTFILSCVWISVYSYIMVWMITVIGHTAGISDTIMALTFIAAGSSVPDAIASVLVVREGEGDMAVSNAVGSNVFDILVCMGLPWFLKSLISVNAVTVYSNGLTYSTLTLLLTVVLLLVATHINGWKLNVRYGIFLMIIYVAFLVVCSLYELNIFGVVHPPSCPYKD